MTDNKKQATKLIQQMRDRDIRFDADAAEEGFKEVAEVLDEFEVTAVSPCGNVGVYMTGAGNLVDIVIKEEALDKLRPQQMGQILAGAINAGRTLVRESIAIVASSQESR